MEELWKIQDAEPMIGLLLLDHRLFYFKSLSDSIPKVNPLWDELLKTSEDYRSLQTERVFFDTLLDLQPVNRC